MMLMVRRGVYSSAHTHTSLDLLGPGFFFLPLFATVCHPRIGKQRPRRTRADCVHRHQQKNTYGGRRPDRLAQ